MQNKMSYFKILQSKIFLWRIKLHCWWIETRHEAKNKRMRKKYCHKGFHKIKTGYLHVSNNKNKTHVAYIFCPYCNYRFFVTEDEKEKYVEMTKIKKLNKQQMFNFYKKVWCDKEG